MLNLSLRNNVFWFFLCNMVQAHNTNFTEPFQITIMCILLFFFLPILSLDGRNIFSFLLICWNNTSHTQKKLTAFPHLFLFSLSYSTECSMTKATETKSTIQKILIKVNFFGVFQGYSLFLTDWIQTMLYGLNSH